jgi:hypothetical protein
VIGRDIKVLVKLMAYNRNNGRKHASRCSPSQAHSGRIDLWNAPWHLYVSKLTCLRLVSIMHSGILERQLEHS